MVFLALLAIAISVLLAISLVLVGLVEAPWPVLLIGLLAALYGLQRELSESQAIASSVEAETSQPQPEKPSKAEPFSQDSPDKPSADEDLLTYRGIRYRVSKPPEPDRGPSQNHDNDTLVEGTYRGQHWQRWRHQADGAAKDSSNASEITYRGHKVIKPDPKPDPGADA